MNNKKILFFDIDGTLISETSGEIPESTKIALKKAQENMQKKQPGRPDFQYAGRLPFYLIQFPDGFRLWPGDCPRIPKHQPGNYSAAGASSASEAAPPPRFPSVIRNTISSLLT